MLVIGKAMIKTQFSLNGEAQNLLKFSSNFSNGPAYIPAPGTFLYKRGKTAIRRRKETS